MKTIEHYLTENIERGVTDFRIRASIGPDEKPQFYIHPIGHDGETLDFVAYSNRLYEVGNKPEGQPMSCMCGCGLTPCMESTQN